MRASSETRSPSCPGGTGSFGTGVLLPVIEREIRIIAANTGELVLDPTRDHQPRTRPGQAEWPNPEVRPYADVLSSVGIDLSSDRRFRMALRNWDQAGPVCS